MTIVQKILRFVRLNQSVNADNNQIVSKGHHKEAGNYFIIYTGNDHVLVQHISDEEFKAYKLNDIYKVTEETFGEC